MNSSSWTTVSCTVVLKTGGAVRISTRWCRPCLSVSGQDLCRELAQLRYIGPVRKLRPRVNIEPGRPDRGSWSDGSAAWSLLLLHDDTDPSAGDLLGKVNDWLARADRLDTGYKLRRQSIVELPADVSPVSQIHFRERLPVEFRNDEGTFDLDRWVREAVAIGVRLYGGKPDDLEARIRLRRGEEGESAGMNATGKHDSAAAKFIGFCTRKISRPCYGRRT